MLIHQCIECEGLSINRIAADDDSDSILAIFRNSLLHNDQVYILCEQQGIEMLDSEADAMIDRQLYGRRMDTIILA